MESVRRNDCEADRSDDSSQDNENSTNRTAIHAILDKLTLPTPETSGWAFGPRGFRANPRYFRNCQNYRDDYLGPGHEIKIEVNSDTEDENSHNSGELAQKLSDDSFLPQKRSRIATEDEPVDLVEQKTACPDSVSTSRIDDGTRDVFLIFVFELFYARNTANE